MVSIVSLPQNPARHFRGRTVLTVRPFPSKVVSSSQKTNRNAFVRLNRNRQMAGMPLLLDAPSHLVTIPNVVYEKIWVTPKTIIFKGV